MPIPSFPLAGMAISGSVQRQTLAKESRYVGLEVFSLGGTPLLISNQTTQPSQSENIPVSHGKIPTHSQLQNEFNESGSYVSK